MPATKGYQAQQDSASVKELMMYWVVGNAVLKKRNLRILFKYPGEEIHEKFPWGENIWIDTENQDFAQETGERDRKETF